jgi:hypothetical protein
MSQTKYSRQFMIERAVNSGESIYIGYDVLLLFMVAVALNVFVLFQFFQMKSMNQDLIFIGIFQLMMGLVGFSFGAIINKGALDISILTKQRITETYMYGPLFASIVMIVDMFISISLPAQSSLVDILGLSKMNIPATAGIVEEAFYSLAMAPLLYKIFKEAVFKGLGVMTNPMSMGTAAIFTGVFFAMIHLYVYAAIPVALLMMFVNRVIYATILLKYRNFSMVVVMHIFHNMLIVMMSGGI